KDDLCKHLVERWRTLFDASFDVLLYDLTSTYFEGSCRQIPKARHGYSRDGRGDCRQVVIALVVTTDGLPLAYEVLAGNTLDHSTLKDFLTKIQTLYGKARRVWVMDRGIPTKATLQQMRDERVGYLVGTPRQLRRVAVLKKQAGRIASFVAIREPQVGQEVNRTTFTCTFKRDEWRKSIERDGSYILRAWLPWDDWPAGMDKQAPALWAWYVQ